MLGENSTFTADIRNLMDYDVYDKDNHKIGKVDGIWEDSSGQPAFLSIRTGWLGMGRSYFVPAHSAEASEKSRIIRLPYDEETLKKAPEFASESDIDQDAELRINEYYRNYESTLPQSSSYDWTPSSVSQQTDFPNQESGFTPAEEPASEEDSLTLKEEQVQVGKRSEEAGGVRIRKVVRTETVNQPVELQREEIVVERVPASGEAATDAGFKEEEIFIPLRRERAEVSKTAQVTGKVKASKRTETDTQNISETVRKEDIQVDREGGAELKGS